MALRLDPIRLGHPNATRIELEPRAAQTGEQLYLHQMTARYKGSKILWAARPMPRVPLMLMGKAGATVLTAEAWLPGRQFDQFEIGTR